MIVKVINPNIGTHRAINTDHATGVIGQDVVISQEPEESNDRIWVLDAIQYSYKAVTGGAPLAAPITGGIIIKMIDADGNEKIKWDADIPDFTGVLNLYIPSQTDKTLRVILKAGGASIVGKLNVQWHLEPAS